MTLKTIIFYVVPDGALWSVIDQNRTYFFPCEATAINAALDASS
jgi:hypothetical protein